MVLTSRYSLMKGLNWTFHALIKFQWTLRLILRTYCDSRYLVSVLIKIECCWRVRNLSGQSNCTLIRAIRVWQCVAGQFSALDNTHLPCSPFTVYGESEIKVQASNNVCVMHVMWQDSLICTMYNEKEERKKNVFSLVSECYYWGFSGWCPRVSIMWASSEWSAWPISAQCTMGKKWGPDRHNIVAHF